MKKTTTIIVVLVLVICLFPITACSSPSSNSGNSISGHVYDERDGSPIKNALIQVNQICELNPTPAISVKPGEPVPVLPPSNPAKAESKTADDGSYKITGLPSGTYFVTVTATQYINARAQIVVTDNSSNAKDFTLYKFSSISGHVYRAEDGKPLAGATIQVWPAFVSPHQTTTAADGSYIVYGIREVVSSVFAGAPGYVTKRYNGAGTYNYEASVNVTILYGEDTPNIDFILERGGSITGQIFESDGVTPAVGVYVEYVQISGIRTPELWTTDLPLPYPPRIQADSNGRYSITERLTGIYELRAVRYTDGKASSKVQVSVVIGQDTAQDFILGN